MAVLAFRDVEREPRGQRIQVVERAIDVIEALAGGASTLTAVAAATGLAKGTAFRILASLAYGNIVVKDPVANTYALGPGLWRVVQATMEGVGSLATLARPALRPLWEASGETLTMQVRTGLERVCVDEMPSPQAIRYMAGVGATAPLAIGASGKVLLAFMEPADRERLVAAVAADGASAAELTERLEAVRRRGWAESVGERVPGAAAIAVPVRGGSGLLIALSVLGPAERLTAERRAEVLPALREAAEAVERVALAAGGGTAARAAA